MASSVSSSKEEDDDDDNNNDKDDYNSSSSEQSCEESYSLSADVSESESSSSFSGRQCDEDAASTSLQSSPVSACRTVSVNDSGFPQFTFPLFGGKDDVMVWGEKKPEK